MLPFSPRTVRIVSRPGIDPDLEGRQFISQHRAVLEPMGHRGSIAA